MKGLYDTAADVVAKALRGLEHAPGEVARAAGVSIDAMGSFLGGRFDAETAARIAEPLGLDEDALANFPEPRLPLDLPPGIRRVELPFEDETVNAWTIGNGDMLMVIDAGLGRRDLADQLPDGTIIDLLVTHPHRDHIGGVAAVADRLRGLHAPVGLEGATVVRPGGVFEAAGLGVSVIDLAGHHPEAVGYRIDGFEMPVLAVGDAVFANSIGGCPGPRAYAQARATIVSALRDLPGETLILTGHGPATTLGIELFRNPFLASWLSAAGGAP